MKHDEITFTGARGASIYSQAWMPEEDPRAMFIVAHGAAEHSGRYERFAEYFTARGYGVAALDHLGHGRSEGTPGYVDRFSDYVVTLDRFRATIALRWAETPQILLGHSMGGLISAIYLLEMQQSLLGCVLSGPAIRSDVEPGLLQMSTIRVLSAVRPKMGVLQLDAGGVSRDPEEVKRYVEDPLVYTGKLSARLVAELFDAMHRVQDEASKITLPLLMLHGGADAMTSPEGSKLLDERARSSNKRLVIYPGLYHEIFNEPEREQVFGDIAAWSDALLAPR